MSKKEIVLDHLLEFKQISVPEAWELYGITRLSASIFELRKEGVHIDTIKEGGRNEFGIYKLVGATEQWNEARVDTIGQNGNDGLHYDKAA